MIRRLYLFEDERARSWAPFALTRPVGEMLHGALLMRERIERATGLSASGYLGLDELEGFEEPGAPPVLDREEMPRGETRILLSSRYRPPLSQGGGTAPSLRLPLDLPDGGVRLSAEGGTVGWILPQDASLPDALRLADPDGGRGSEAGPWERLPVVELPGGSISDPWSLMAANPERIVEDLALLFPGGEGPGARALDVVEGVVRLGDHPVSVGEGAEVEPGAVLDTRAGPIHLGAGVRVRALTRLEGPAFIGPGSTLLGGAICALSCGPICKLHGEIDASVVLGYSNKAHDGYLGHAVLGRWVNLGAMTTNSDLKNTYGTVRVPGPRGEGDVDTGLLKAGALVGDHAKTGIGMLLTTGAVVGAGANLFGAAIAPRAVPPFTWGTGPEPGVYRKESFLTTAERVMGRRDVPLTPSMHTLLSRIWDRACGEDGTP